MTAHDEQLERLSQKWEKWVKSNFNIDPATVTVTPSALTQAAVKAGRATVDSDGVYTWKRD